MHACRCCRSIRRGLSWLVISVSLLANKSSACLDGVSAGRPVVYQQQVALNFTLADNTTFYPIPEVAITVTNAPTTFDGVTTLTWVQTVVETYIITSSTDSISPVPSPVATPSSFILAVSGIGVRQRRQAGTYFVGVNGSVTNDCTQAPIYSASSGGVLTETINGTTYTFSTNSGVTSQIFSASTSPGSITTAFSVGSGGVLTWSNPAFYNGQAAFCALTNGTVYAVFSQNGTPDGCRYVQLSMFSGLVQCSLTNGILLIWPSRFLSGNQHK